MIDPARYRLAVGIPEGNRQGGQELILPEILAAIPPKSKVVLPFRSSSTLAQFLGHFGHKVVSTNDQHFYSDLPPGDVLYFGTPTIVNDEALFEDSEQWTALKERSIVRELVMRAKELGYKQIISGLGSGDVSPAQRQFDMGPGATMIAYKNFGEFEDWVFARSLV